MRLGERVEIKIRNKFDGETIFAYTCKDNTLGKTVMGRLSKKCRFS